MPPRPQIRDSRSRSGRKVTGSARREPGTACGIARGAVIGEPHTGERLVRDAISLAARRAGAAAVRRPRRHRRPSPGCWPRRGAGHRGRVRRTRPQRRVAPLPWSCPDRAALLRAPPATGPGHRRCPGGWLWIVPWRDAQHRLLSGKDGRVTTERAATPSVDRAAAILRYVVPRQLRYCHNLRGVDGDEYHRTQPPAIRGRCELGGVPGGNITPEPPEERPARKRCSVDPAARATRGPCRERTPRRARWVGCAG